LVWGKCPCCGLDSDLTKDHVKDDRGNRTGETIGICRDCHVRIENYRRQVAKLRLNKGNTKEPGGTGILAKG
jgi:hypothetical protein